MKFFLSKGSSKKTFPVLWKTTALTVVELRSANAAAISCDIEKQALLFCFQLTGRTILGKRILRPQELTLSNSEKVKLRSSGNWHCIFIAISQKQLKEWKIPSLFFSGMKEKELFMDVCIHSDLMELVNCEFEKETKDIFVKGKLLQLLARIKSLNSKPAKRKHIRSEYDLERILFARDYLLQNIATPPGLPHLARIAGINELKLKMGFREVFDNTVYGYLSDIRLEKSKQELSGKKTLTEIAFELGYSSNQHFSMAFKKKFGVAPSSLRK